MLGSPKRLKKRSNGEPGGNGSSSSLELELTGRSILTRTEITDGFTFSTISAKPTGRCASCCTFSVRFCACAAAPKNWDLGPTLGATRSAAAPNAGDRRRQKRNTPRGQDAA